MPSHKPINWNRFHFVEKSTPKLNHFLGGLPRRQIFNEGSFEYFHQIMQQVRDVLPEIQILTMNHDKDHIHLHLSISPKLCVSDVVRTIKSISGRILKKKFDYMKKAYWGIDGIWSDGYFVSTIGVNEFVIKKYIESQGQEDMGQAQLVLDFSRQ